MRVVRHATAVGVILTVLAPIVAATHAFDSIIKPAVRTVYWGVTSDECTAVHALNVSTGALAWRRSPVGDEQTWSMQVTDKRVFYTLQTGPSVTEVSIDTGNIRWSWPARVGRVWRRWDTDLPQKAQLATPLPALAAQLLLLRPQEGGSQVLALNLTNGNLNWEYDAHKDISKAAADAGLGAPHHLSVNSWLLAGPNMLFLSLNAAHPAAPTAPSGPQPAAQQAGAQATTRTAQGLDADAGSTGQPSAGPPATAGKAKDAGGRKLAGWLRDGGGDADADVETYGWVLAVELGTGRLLWASGPLEHAVDQLVLSEPTLLVTAVPDGDGSGWQPTMLYGLDKGSGALLYSLPCAIGPCTVQVMDNRVGLLTASFRQQQPQPSELAAFELATGDELWRGLPSSSLLSHVVGDCSAIAAPRMHIYFACTCNAPAEGAMVQPAGLMDARAQAGTEGVERRRRPSPPKPPPPPEPGLCAFAVAADTGRLGFEVVLSASDSIPYGAAAYDFKPLATADVMVFRGHLGVYAVPQLSHTPDANASTRSTAHAGIHSIATAGGLGSAAGTEEGADISPAEHGESATARRALLQDLPSVQVQYSFRLPDGLALQAWDWLDLKAGKLVLQASPPAPALQFSAVGKKHDDPDEPASSWLFALNAQNGTLIWSLATNMSLGPLNVHPLSHDWGRGGLLLVDGCRPPVDEFQSSWLGRFWSARPAKAAQTRQAGSRRAQASFNYKARSTVLPHSQSLIPTTATWQARAAAVTDDDGGDEAHRGPEPESAGDGMSCCLYAVSVDSGRVAWQHCYDMSKACSSGLKRNTATNIVYILLATQVLVLVIGCTVGVVRSRRPRRAAAGLPGAIMHDPDSDNEALLVNLPAAPGVNHTEWDSNQNDEGYL